MNNEKIIIMGESAKEMVEEISGKRKNKIPLSYYRECIETTEQIERKTKTEVKKNEKE